MDRKFGRIYLADERDANYPIRMMKTRRTYRYWNANGWWGDQLDTPFCIGYAWAHWLDDGPVTHGKTKPPLVNPAELYRRAQELDVWPGSNYEGSSIRGGVKAVKSLGYVSEYRWTCTLSALVNAVLEQGPVVVGTLWWAGMSHPDKQGVLRATGYVEGGHAYVINGVNTRKAMFRIKNSWGRGWGLGGLAWVPFEDMGRLIEDADGECCLATEVKK